MWVSILFAENDFREVCNILREENVTLDQTEEPHPVEGDRVCLVINDYKGKRLKSEVLQNGGIPYVLDYGADDGIILGHIACDGKERAHVDARDSWLMVPFDQKLGIVSPGAVAEAKRYLEVQERAMKAMESREKRLTTLQNDLFANQR